MNLSFRNSQSRLAGSPDFHTRTRFCTRRRRLVSLVSRSLALGTFRPVPPVSVPGRLLSLRLTSRSVGRSPRLGSLRAFHASLLLFRFPLFLFRRVFLPLAKPAQFRESFANRQTHDARHVLEDHLNRYDIISASCFHDRRSALCDCTVSYSLEIKWACNRMLERKERSSKNEEVLR